MRTALPIGSHWPPNLINLNSVSALPRGKRSTPALHLPHSSSSPQSGTNSLEKSACVRLCNHRFPQAQFCLRWWGVFFIWNESTSGTHLTWFGKSCVSDPENKTKKFCENKPDFFFLLRGGLILLPLDLACKEEKERKRKRARAMHTEWAWLHDLLLFLVGWRGRTYVDWLNYSTFTERDKARIESSSWLLSLWVSCTGKMVQDEGRH